MKNLYGYIIFIIKTLAYSVPMLFVLLGLNIIPVAVENGILGKSIFFAIDEPFDDALKLWGLFVLILVSISSIIFWVGIRPARKS
jgi:hypothetical protein